MSDLNDLVSLNGFNPASMGEADRLKLLAELETYQRLTTVEWRDWQAEIDFSRPLTPEQSAENRRYEELIRKAQFKADYLRYPLSWPGSIEAE